MFSRRAALAVVLLPLVFTGKAMLLGRLYGPSDLYYGFEPWRRLAAEQRVAGPRNAILSDLAFANLPWRAAVHEAVSNGRLPLWNRFVLGGTPLLASAQAGILHPSTLLGLFLPMPLSWTFSCTFTLLLALLAAFLFFRDFGLGERAALVGAVGWGFSTYLVFWNGWAVGPSTATLPLLLLALRRLAREPGRRAIGLTAAALLLSLLGGHPESVFHSAAAGAVWFVFELLPRRRRDVARALGAAAVAGLLALALSGPQLFPLLEAIPHSAEYRARREALATGGPRQSVPISDAAARLLPDLLPFAHGIYGRSAVQAERADGSGMPLGYAGAVLFPLAALAFAPGGERRRGRGLFLGFAVFGLAYGASVPVLLDWTSRLPGFELALNYRLVFLAPLGLAGLAAFGARELERVGRARTAALAAAITSAVLLAAFLLAQGVFRNRGLSSGFVASQLAIEVAPLLLLAAAGFVRSRRLPLAGAALVLIVAQRGLEMGGTYPTLPVSTLAPPLPTLRSLPLGSQPCRVVAPGNAFRPNGAALYGIEDVRGYESLVLARLSDTYPLWCLPQHASFNRVENLARPFLAFLNVCWALDGPDGAAPSGWLEKARGPEMAVFESPRALPRAFVPRTLRRESNAARLLAAMGRAEDFADTVWLSEAGLVEESNGEATLRIREAGPDLVLAVQASGPALVATSLPDWPGWRAEAAGRPLPLVTVNHAFLGFRFPKGEGTVRLSYWPRSFTLGLGFFAAGVALALAMALTSRPPAS